MNDFLLFASGIPTGMLFALLVVSWNGRIYKRTGKCSCAEELE